MGNYCGYACTITVPWTSQRSHTGASISVSNTTRMSTKSPKKRPATKQKKERQEQSQNTEESEECQYRIENITGFYQACIPRENLQTLGDGGCIYGRFSHLGRGTYRRRSSRPGRSMAWSMSSGRLVAATTKTFFLASNPSISVSSWFT